MTKYLIQNKSEPEDRFIFDSAEKARAFVLEKDLSEDTYVLMSVTKNDSVTMGFFENSNGKLAGVNITTSTDQGFSAIIMAMSHI